MASRDTVSHPAPARMHQECQEPQDAISIFRDVYLIVNQKALLQSLHIRQFCSKKCLCSVSVTPLNLGEAHPLMKINFAFHCCCSVAQSCLTLCDPIDCSTLGLPVLHHLPELAQTHVHWVSDAIQPSHPLLSPSPPAFNLSHHQGLFSFVGSLYQVFKVLELQFQHQSF